jgi:hypothetical protein
MADVPRTGTVSLASPLIPANNKHNKIAGEALVAGDACYIKSDGLAWKSTGAAANAAAQVDGFAAESASVGEPVTLVFGVTLRYATALTPGAKLFLSGATAGALADAASTGGTAWVGKVVDASRLYVQKSTY